MAATDLETSTPARPAKRPFVWPWAVLSAVVFGLLLPIAMGLLDLPRPWEIPLMVGSAVAGFAVPYLLAPYPALRVRLLSIAVLVAAVWAVWAYRTNMHRWRPDLGDDYLLPWGVSNVPSWAVAIAPIVVGICVVVALVAVVRLARGRLERTGWWTAALSSALLICCLCALQVLLNRAYTV